MKNYVAEHLLTFTSELICCQRKMFKKNAVSKTPPSKFLGEQLQDRFFFQQVHFQRFFPSFSNYYSKKTYDDGHSGTITDLKI